MPDSRQLYIYCINLKWAIRLLNRNEITLRNRRDDSNNSNRTASRLLSYCTVLYCTPYLRIFVNWRSKMASVENTVVLYLSSVCIPSTVCKAVLQTLDFRK